MGTGQFPIRHLTGSKVRTGFEHHRMVGQTRSDAPASTSAAAKDLSLATFRLEEENRAKSILRENTVTAHAPYTHTIENISKKPRILLNNNIKHLILKFENEVEVPGNDIHINTIDNILLPRAKASLVPSAPPPTQQPTPPQQKHTTKQTQHTNTITRTQLLNMKQHINKHSISNTNNINIATVKMSNHLIQRYNNIKHNRKHTNKKKTFNIPTFNTKFSLRGSALTATVSANQPGGKEPPLGLGGNLVVVEDLYQGTSASSSVANSLQQSSSVTQAQANTRIIKNKYKNKKFKPIWFTQRNKLANQPMNPTQTIGALNNNNNNNTHNNNNNNNSRANTLQAPRASRARQKKRKGRATNKWNSKQRKLLKTPAPEGLPSGSPGQPRGFAFCGDQTTQAIPLARSRNTKRGLRSKQKTEERKIKRNYKKTRSKEKTQKRGSSQQSHSDKECRLGFGSGTTHKKQNRARQSNPNSYLEH